MMSLMCSIPTETCDNAASAILFLGAKRGTHPNKVGRNTSQSLLCLVQLLMRRRGGVDDERLRIAHVRQVARELELIYHSTSYARIALDTETEHTAECSGPEKAFGVGVAWVARESGVGYPGDGGVLFKPSE